MRTDEGVGCRLLRRSLGHLLPLWATIMYVSVSMTRADTCLQTRPAPSPNGGVGVEPITSSAHNGAMDLINQSRSRSAGVLEHESESCTTPDGGDPNNKHLTQRQAEMERRFLK